MKYQLRFKPHDVLVGGTQDLIEDFEADDDKEASEYAGGRLEERRKERQDVCGVEVLRHVCTIE